MNNKLKEIDRNVEILCANSIEYEIIKKHQLPGGLINAIWEKSKQFFNKESVYIDKLGKQIVFKLTNQLKTILCITLYHIPNGTRGVYSTLSQYN